jgi:hypothetical protein
VKTDPKVTSKKIPKTKVKKKEINPIKEQYNLNDLILINVSACLLIIYFIIPLFPKTPLTVLIATVLLFILAGYTIIATLYPKKYNIKKLVTGIILGNKLFLVYQIALFYDYINFFIENIVLWLLIFILVLSLITYYRRERADREEKKHFQNYNQNPNLINLVNNVIQERDQNKKISPAHKEDTFQYLRSRADEKKQTNNKTTAGKSTNKRPETIIILSIILIAILVTAISATTIYIIKP